MKDFFKTSNGLMNQLTNEPQHVFLDNLDFFKPTVMLRNEASLSHPPVF